MSKQQKEFARLLRVAGLEFIQDDKSLPGTPDMSFENERLVVFFHGCFWHAHFCQLDKPKSLIVKSRQASQKKLDEKIYEQLSNDNFRIVVIWSCEFERDQQACVDLIKNRLYFAKLALEDSKNK